jgi:hypothetical protein
MNDRSHIHLLAAIIRAGTDFKLPMRDCLNAAEGAYAEAEIVDAEVQRKLDEEEKAAQPPAPLTDKLQ